MTDYYLISSFDQNFSYRPTNSIEKSLSLTINIDQGNSAVLVATIKLIGPAIYNNSKQTIPTTE